ncbi:MAG: winged helix-turn-helix domain-containing protein [Candidatus Wallbacteria bacterium]|nr:winged helix-turn-helix domain-containing protein [Candidatus Wallbacteria bacterium]
MNRHADELENPADDSRFFCGRIAEQNQLQEAFSERRVILIAGIGGIGKTALAVKLYQNLQVDQKTSGRLIFIKCLAGWNFSDFSSEIIEQAVRLTGRKKYLASVSRLPNQLAEMLEENGIILFIDDFQLIENSEVQEFITEAIDYFQQARLVLISRNRPEIPALKLIEVFELRLGGLDFNETWEMASHLLRDSSDLKSVSRDKLFEKVKGHPFFIKMSLSVSRNDSNALETLLESTECEFELLDQIWKNLSAVEKEILTSLSFMRAPVKQFPGCRNEEHRSALKKLLNRYLVDTDLSGRYFLHDIFREHIKEKSDVEAVLMIHRQIAVDLCLENAGIDEQLEAYYHFLEAGMLTTAVDQIILLGKKFQLLNEGAVRFDNLLSQVISECGEYRNQELIRCRIEFLIIRGAYREAESLLDSIHSRAEYAYLSGLMNYYRDQGALAIRQFRDAVSMGLESEQYLNAIAIIASSYDWLGDAETAEKYFLQALSSPAIMDHPLIKARILANYASCLYPQGRCEKARECFGLAEEIQRTCGATGPLAGTLLTESWFFLMLNDLERSLACLNEARDLLMRIDDRRNLVNSMINLACIENRRGQPEPALEHLSSAFEQAEALDLEVEQGYASREAGNIQMQLGQFGKARNQLKKALKIFEKLDTPVTLAFVRMHYGKLQLLTGYVSESEDMLTSVCEVSKKARNSILSASNYFFLYLLYRSSGDGRAEQCYADHLEMLDKLPLSTQKMLKKELSEFESRQSGKGADRIRLFLPGNDGIIAGASEIELARSRRNEYEIFMDFEKSYISIRGREVPLFSKKVLAKLLQQMVSNPGHVFSSDEIFAAVWGCEFDPEVDGSPLRRSIFRLRQILGDVKGGHFICSASEKGSYFFNRQVDYCAIFPVVPLSGK